jgi:hypothetical protein
MTAQPMKESCIAVFGDTHGRLRLMFQLCRLWQLRHKRHLDGILQCGDLGYFPDLSRIDDATRRFADEDPEELGFANFFGFPDPLEQDGRLTKCLEGPADSLDTVRVPAMWCHGNHEDFDELAYTARGPSPCPVDYFGKLIYLPSGTVTEVAGVRVAAVGGSFGERQHHKPRNGGQAGDYDSWQRINSSVCDQVRAAQPIDVLISHVAPASAPGEVHCSGSYDLRDLVQDCQPHYHFFAHHRGPIAPFKSGS